MGISQKTQKFHSFADGKVQIRDGILIDADGSIYNLRVCFRISMHGPKAYILSFPGYDRVVYVEAKEMSVFMKAVEESWANG